MVVADEVSTPSRAYNMSCGVEPEMKLMSFLQ